MKQSFIHHSQILTKKLEQEFGFRNINIVSHQDESLEYILKYLQLDNILKITNSSCYSESSLEYTLESIDNISMPEYQIAINKFQQFLHFSKPVDTITESPITLFEEIERFIASVPSDKFDVYGGFLSTRQHENTMKFKLNSPQYWFFKDLSYHSNVIYQKLKEKIGKKIESRENDSEFIYLYSKKK